MPLYADVVIAAHATIEKMCAHRNNIPGRIRLDTGGGTGASMERVGHNLVLHLPNWSPDKAMSRAEADRIVGYLVHEIAHWLHTEWRQWEAAAREGGFVKSMTNALEDLRIERVEQGLGIWQGFGSAMASLVNHMDRENQTTPRAQPLGSVAADLPWLVALVGRATCNRLDIPGAARAQAGIHPKLKPVLARALREAGATQSCADCHKLARKLARMIRDSAAKQDKPKAQKQSQDKDDTQGQEEGQEEGQSQGQEEGQEGQEQGQAQNETQGQGQGEGQEEEGQEESQGQGQEEEGATPGGMGAGSGKWDDTTTTEHTPDPELGADVQGEEAQGNASTLAVQSKFEVRPSPWGLADVWAAKARRDRLPRSALLHDQVGQLVAAQEVRRMERRLTAGRFDRRAVARAAMGALDVCAHRHVTPGCDTAVCLLLDLSGSMANSKIAAATTMAIHLSEAVDVAGGKSAVVGFGDPHSGAPGGSGCTLVLFKDWHEAPALGARRMALAQTPYGTPLSPAIIAGARWMLGTIQADRYLLGVLTDGTCQYGIDATQAACRTAVALGVDLFALGCMHDTSVPFRGFPRADVENVRDLPKVAMRTLLRELEA